MPKYLGKTPIISDRTKEQWALKYIESYGQIGGEHHKSWVLDQISRILLGTPVVVTLAKWDDGQEEERFSTGKPSIEYVQWVKSMKKGGYSYDEGIAP